MPRLPRLVLPGVPLHITQRGVDRRPTFLAPEDHACYRFTLREAAERAGCAVHAFALMGNHVHLLVTPSDAEGAARLMRSLGLRYVRYFNLRYARTGTLWESRYRSAVVDSAAYFFACSRYIELNPVRAGMVTAPAEYNWSSFRCNALGRHDPLITPHGDYEALGPDRHARCAAYRALFSTEFDEFELARIRTDVRRCPQLRSIGTDSVKSA